MTTSTEGMHGAPPRGSSLPVVTLLIVGGLGFLGGWFVHSWRADRAGKILSVNSKPITHDTYFHRLELAAARPVLEAMVKEDLTLQFADKENVTPTPEQIEARYKEVSQQPDFEKTMLNGLQTPEDIKHALKVEMARDAALTKGVTVSDADVDAFYRRNQDRNNPQARYYRPDTVQIAAILTSTQAEAQKAKDELARSVPFAEVAVKYSKDVSRNNGGLLPPIQKGRGNFKGLPGLEKMVFAMQPGDQKGPIEIGGKWWLVRCVDRAKEETVPFEKVKEECRRLALLEKAVQANGPAREAEFAKFRDSAKIEADDPRYKPLVGKK